MASLFLSKINELVFFAIKISDMRFIHVLEVHFFPSLPSIDVNKNFLQLNERGYFCFCIKSRKLAAKF